MNKIRFTFFCIAFLFGISACNPFLRFSTDSVKVTNTAAEITDFDLPKGFYSDFCGSFMDYKITAFINGDTHSHIYLIQAEKNSDQGKLLKALDRLVPGTKDLQSRMEVTDIRPMTIKGQKAELIISEGSNSDGEAYSQFILTFQGKGGPALLVFSQPFSIWSTETGLDLVNSIR